MTKTGRQRPEVMKARRRALNGVDGWELAFTPAIRSDADAVITAGTPAGLEHRKRLGTGHWWLALAHETWLRGQVDGFERFIRQTVLL